MIKFIKILIILLVSQIPSLASEIQIPFQRVSGQPYFESVNLAIDSADYNTLILELNSKKRGTARIFWASSYNMQFNQSKSIQFSIRKGNHKYHLNIPSQNPNWLGWIPKFLLYPEISPENVQIVSAKVIRGNLFTSLASGWQEFWGPGGRKVLGNTINVIFATKFMGTSVNSYIYWILLVTLIVLLFNNFIKTKKIINFNEWENIGKKVVLGGIICWGLLEISSTYSYWGIFLSDLNSYFGKTAEQKAEISVGRNFYSFIKFCKKTLPKKGADIGMIWDPKYGPLELKGRYYLFPDRMGSDPHPKENTPFILVYHAENDPFTKYPEYALLARYKENELILKKK